MNPLFLSAVLAAGAVVVAVGVFALGKFQRPSTTKLETQVPPPTDSVEVPRTAPSPTPSPAQQPPSPLPGQSTLLSTSDNPTATPLSPDVLFERAAPAVVEIEIRKSNGEVAGSGTGFFVSPTGTLVTNSHVALAEDAAFLVITLPNNSKLFVDQVLAVNENMDLALLETRISPPAYLPLADYSVRTGARVFAIGNPQGLRLSLSEGLVSAVRPVDDDHAVVQTTAAISGGSSGGPLLDDKGHVIGVTTFKLNSGESLNFAFPASAVRELLAASHTQKAIADLSPDSTPPPDSTSLVAPTATRPPKYVTVTDKAETLFALTEVRVIVEELHADAAAAGLRKDDLQATLERRVRALGLAIVPSSSEHTDRRVPYLYLNVATIASADQSTYGYVVDLSLNQAVDISIPHPTEDLRLHTSAETWTALSRFGSCGRLRLIEAVDRALQSQFDQFASDYRSVNPSP